MGTGVQNQTICLKRFQHCNNARGKTHSDLISGEELDAITLVQQMVQLQSLLTRTAHSDSGNTSMKVSRKKGMLKGSFINAS